VINSQRARLNTAIAEPRAPVAECSARRCKLFGAWIVHGRTCGDSGRLGRIPRARMWKLPSSMTANTSWVEPA